MERLKELPFTQDSALVHQRTTWKSTCAHSARRLRCRGQIEALTGSNAAQPNAAVLKEVRHEAAQAGTDPAKADPEVQEVFKAEQLDPRLAEAQAGQRAVFLGCRAFGYAPFLAWSGVHAFVRQSAERPPTLECPGGLACHNERDRYGAKPDVRDRRDGVRVAAAAGGDVPPCRSRSYSTIALSKVRPGAGTRPKPGH